MHHESVLTNQHRLRRTLIIDASCLRCNHNEKTILHAIRDCLCIKLVWLRMVKPREWDWFFSSLLSDWIWKNLVTRGIYDNANWSSINEIGFFPPYCQIGFGKTWLQIGEVVIMQTGAPFLVWLVRCAGCIGTREFFMEIPSRMQIWYLWFLGEWRNS